MPCNFLKPTNGEHSFEIHDGQEFGLSASYFQTLKQKAVSVNLQILEAVCRKLVRCRACPDVAVMWPHLHSTD